VCCEVILRTIISRTYIVLYSIFIKKNKVLKTGIFVQNLLQFKIVMLFTECQNEYINYLEFQFHTFVIDIESNLYMTWSWKNVNIH